MKPWRRRMLRGQNCHRYPSEVAHRASHARGGTRKVYGGVISDDLVRSLCCTTLSPVSRTLTSPSRRTPERGGTRLPLWMRAVRSALSSLTIGMLVMCPEACWPTRQAVTAAGDTCRVLKRIQKGSLPQNRDQQVGAEQFGVPGDGADDRRRWEKCVASSPIRTCADRPLGRKVKGLRINGEERCES